MLVFGVFACTRQDGALRERGLPVDLPHYWGQLKTLKVPAGVASLAWIPPTLRELDASGTELESISFVPMGMERLDLHAAKNLTQLPTLPSSIRELDIRFTQITGPWRFPHELQSLALGGDGVKTLDGLGRLQLLELDLDEVPNLKSTAGLPASLQVLSISGATFSQLIELPPRLKELRLTNTQIRTLKELPESLQEMTLDGNGLMEVELPRSLLSLKVGAGQGQLRSLESVPFLNQLELEAWSVPVQALPPFLRSLRVPAVRDGIALSPSLRRLSFLQEAPNVPVQPVPSLPPGLEELRWPGGSRLQGLPASLKSLDISSSPLTRLPPGLRLESLDISFTRVDVATLPVGLQRLRYWFCPLPAISRLPAGLRSLDLKGSKYLRALQVHLPRLERLNVSETSLEKLPRLADTLMELDISNTRITTLADLKNLRRLRRLTVHAGQLQSLGGLPASVTDIRFVEPR